MLSIVRVLAPNPGPFTLEGTNTWLVGDGPVAVIDPGPEDEGHLEAIQRDASKGVAAILLTHDHPDHAPAALVLAERTGAPVRALRPPPGGNRLRDGEVVEVPGAHIRAVQTPGHTADHAAFHVEAAQALFTGDAVLGRGTTVINPPEGDLEAYMRSLRRMRSLDPRTIYPGHGPTVFDPADRIDGYLKHRREREEQVLEALGRGPATPADLVATVYGEEIDEGLRPAASRQVLAHLVKLEREGRAVRSGSGDRARFHLSDPRGCEQCGRPVRGGARLCGRCSLDVLQERPGSGDVGTPR